MVDDSAATQYVLEDKIMKTYSVEAMLAVGYEGFFGTFSLLLCLPILYLFPSIPLRVIPPASELTHGVLLASTLFGAKITTILVVVDAEHGNTSPAAQKRFNLLSVARFGLAYFRKVSNWPS